MREATIPYNGSGTYAPPSSPGAFNPALSGSSATPSAWNTLLADITTALSTVICSDGQTTPTANIPMGNNKITSLANGTASTDAVAYGQISGFVPAGMRSMLAGLNTSNNSGTPNTKIDVAAGTCMDSTQAYVLTLIAGTIDCATTGANALDTGSLANSTWYHTFAIGKTTGETALLASTSATAPTMPSGYTLKRRIGSFKTDGSAHIITFIQYGAKFEWLAPVADISANASGSSAVTRTLASVPTGVVVEPILSVALDVLSTSPNIEAVYLSALTQTDAAATRNNSQVIISASTGGDLQIAGFVEGVFTNTSAQIRSRQSQGGAAQTLTIVTHGWIDTRGKDA